ncbi:MAG: response regulator transcription factor [Anaerolineae bacterium]|nr:response regulator transcription factor [Anaerolineae bacterium]
MMAYILIVDDDAEVLGTVWRALSREGFEVLLADSAAQARERIEQRRPDLLILDIMMPEKDGLQFCQELRHDERYRTLPILFLSAKWHTDDVVAGLDAGGDDYLTKPFELKELNARVKAMLRRSPPSDESPSSITVGDLKLDTNTFQISTPALERIQLTSTEFRLIEHLMTEPDQAHSVHELLDVVWEYPPGTGDPDLVRAHIRNLRAKLEPDTRNPIYILTIHGVGYMVKS